MKKTSKKSKNNSVPLPTTTTRTTKVVCITGTPGSGKTELCAELKKQLDADDQFRFVNVGDLIKENKLFTEWDDEMNCSIFDEKLVKRALKEISEGSQDLKGLIVDFHSVGFLPRKFVDKVIVLQVDTKELWNRLEKRGYPEKKIQENVQAEIFMESLNEALDRFDPAQVEQKPNNTLEERKAILSEVVSFLVSR